MDKNIWLGKPYYSLNAYFKYTYGKKIYKLAVNAGFTCPNRDGTLDDRGCIFCSAGGSGDFADTFCMDITRQIEKGLERFDKAVGDKFVIYFQAYTNTYADVSYLEKVYRAALSNDRVVGISIATRPDCLGDDVVTLLDKLNQEYKDKFIWVELGLQTIHEKTAEYIRRHYPLAAYDAAVRRLYGIHIPVITHVILGLPYESTDMMLETVGYVSDITTACMEKAGESMGGIKLQLLHVLKGTDLALDYEKGLFTVMGQEEYIDLVIDCIKRIDEKIVIHRVTGDGPKRLLVAPAWSGNKKGVLNMLHKKLREQNAVQGEHYLKQHSTGI